MVVVDSDLERSKGVPDGGGRVLGVCVDSSESAFEDADRVLGADSVFELVGDVG